MILLRVHIINYTCKHLAHFINKHKLGCKLILKLANNFDMNVIVSSVLRSDYDIEEINGNITVSINDCDLVIFLLNIVRHQLLSIT